MRQPGSGNKDRHEEQKYAEHGYRLDYGCLPMGTTRNSPGCTSGRRPATTLVGLKIALCIFVPSAAFRLYVIFICITGRRLPTFSVTVLPSGDSAADCTSKSSKPCFLGSVTLKCGEPQFTVER